MVAKPDRDQGSPEGSSPQGSSREGDDLGTVDTDSHVAWNRKARGENKFQQLDRNFSELLQELRVAQAGVQILFAFLLTLAFTNRFGEISQFQREVYVTALMMTLASTGLLIAPVAYHRLTFRRQMRPQLVSLAGIFAIGGLTFLMLGTCTAIFFILDVVLSRGAAIALTAVATGWLLVFWYVVPITGRLRYRYDEDAD
ncbi:MAG: hypothetical protein QOD41_412 [Cryptosporangiaceae bacterium]|jgi:hypothetical protein|nr:hypothetical protein [Cryptosporangiaceae bacterium]